VATTAHKGLSSGRSAKTWEDSGAPRPAPAAVVLAAPPVWLGSDDVRDLGLRSTVRRRRQREGAQALAGEGLGPK
jgi:hypothetical protein